VDDPRETEQQRIEREIRSRREFSLAEAVGREGAFFLKGESPVAREQQLRLAMEDLAKTHLRDGEGALVICLVRRARAGSGLETESTGAERETPSPATALRRAVEFILQGEARLRDFVTEVDAEWGRLYRERPHFDRPGQPPDSEDPYPLEKVHESLKHFLAALGPSEGKP